MDVVDVLGVLAVGEQRAVNCEGSAIYEEAHLARKEQYNLLERSVRLREDPARLT